VIWTLYLPGFIPTPLNQLMGSWKKAMRLKAHDAEIIRNACLAYAVPQANVKRRVSLLVVWPPGRRACDPDALYKSTFDALAGCGLLVDDSAKWVRFDQPEYARGSHAATYITISDES